jgi:hypothetical protein
VLSTRAFRLFLESPTTIVYLCKSLKRYGF